MLIYLNLFSIPRSSSTYKIHNTTELKYNKKINIGTKVEFTQSDLMEIRHYP